MSRNIFHKNQQLIKYAALSFRDRFSIHSFIFQTFIGIKMLEMRISISNNQSEIVSALTTLSRSKFANDYKYHEGNLCSYIMPLFSQ